MTKGNVVFSLLGGSEFLGFRGAGPGLGNMLIPWARAAVFARRHQLPSLQPTWPQIKLGPALRGELDSRSYWKCFVPHTDELSGLRKYKMLATSTWLSEGGQIIHRGIRTQHAVRMFSGLEGLFGPLAGWEDFLRRRLFDVTRSELIPTPPPRPFFAVHYRCGDFKLAEGSRNTFPKEGIGAAERLPVEFMRKVVESLIDELGNELECRLYSDGKDAELSPLLELKGVHRVPPRAAITDILEMTHARLLVLSPFSTFSMWSAFLGGMPSIGFKHSGTLDFGYRPTWQLESTTLPKDLEALIKQGPVK